METRRSFCRICTAYCGLSADVEDGRLIAIRGDPNHALSRGYTVSRGDAFRMRSTIPSGSGAHSSEWTKEASWKSRAVERSTNALIAVDHDYDPICGQPRMSAIPIRLRRPST
ncbi:MAG: hypothetical protein CL908_08495 [Deltaproteobacteria bacterium]|nr:hypothetical protein [Deltaproteobacteria bacterium]